MEIKIGNKLIQLRKRNKFTQNEIADKLGIARSTYSNYERNYNEPDLTVLAKLSSIYDVTIDYLLDMERNITVLKDDERILLSKFNQLNDNDKNDIVDYIDYKKDKNNINSNLA